MDLENMTMGATNLPHQKNIMDTAATAAKRKTGLGVVPANRATMAPSKSAMNFSVTPSSSSSFLFLSRRLNYGLIAGGHVNGREVEQVERGEIKGQAAIGFFGKEKKF